MVPLAKYNKYFVCNCKRSECEPYDPSTCFGKIKRKRREDVCTIFFEPMRKDASRRHFLRKDHIEHYMSSSMFRIQYVPGVNNNCCSYDPISPYLCGYRKGYSAQHALITLLEKWKVSIDNMGFGGAILMDLSKAFDTLNHDLLLAKHEAYGFNRDSLLLIKSYLSNRWQADQN